MVRTRKGSLPRDDEKEVAWEARLVVSQDHVTTNLIPSYYQVLVFLLSIRQSRFVPICTSIASSVDDRRSSLDKKRQVFSPQVRLQ